MAELPKRRWRNLLIDPSFQIKQWALFLSYFLVVVFLLVGYLSARLTQTFTALAVRSQDIQGAELIFEALIKEMIYFFGGSLIFLIVSSFVVSIIHTHRVAGPQVSILRLIRKLKDGEYGEQFKLRKSDELQEIMKELNELSLKLKDNKPS